MYFPGQFSQSYEDIIDDIKATEPVEPTSKKYLWLKARLLKQKQITSWHLNDDFLLFLETFYPKPSSPQNWDSARRSLSYYMRLLVKFGYAHPVEKTGTGFYGFNDFGAKTQSIWYLK